jgi:hypothetical protein
MSWFYGAQPLEPKAVLIKAGTLKEISRKEDTSFNPATMPL